MHGMIPAWGENLLELDPSETGSGGGAMAAYIDDRPVLDAWWGESRPGVPWASNTLCVSMSTAKAVIATAVAALVDRGELEVGRPVAAYWPAFGSAGKHHVTVADVLQHRSGTPYPPGYRRIASQDDPDLWEQSSALAQMLAESAHRQLGLRRPQRRAVAGPPCGDPSGRWRPRRRTRRQRRDPDPAPCPSTGRA
jgi:CubicO group peptidase (beta-lactamase class C family)